MESIRVTDEGKVLTLTILGEIDHHSAKEIRKEADKQILSRQPKSVRLDLSRVSFMDSSGLGLIMGRYALVSDIGATLTVVDPTDAVARIILMAGLEKIVPMERSRT